MSFARRGRITFPRGVSWRRAHADTACRTIFRPPLKACPPPAPVPPGFDRMHEFVEEGVGAALARLAPIEMRLSSFQRPGWRSEPSRPSGLFVTSSTDAATQAAAAALKAAWEAGTSASVTVLTPAVAGDAVGSLRFTTGAFERGVVDRVSMRASSTDAWDMLLFSIRAGGHLLLDETRMDALESGGLSVQVPPNTKARLYVRSLDPLAAFSIALALEGWLHPVRGASRDDLGATAMSERRERDYTCGRCGRVHS